MNRFVEGEDRAQVTLLPECLDDYIAADRLRRAARGVTRLRASGTHGDTFRNCSPSVRADLRH